MAKSKTTHETAETMESAFHNGAETMKNGFDTTMKGYDRMVSLAKDNTDAFIKSANVAGKGIETINNEIVTYSRKRMEDGVAAAKAIFSARNINEAIEMQAEYVRAAFDSHVAQFSRLSQMAVDTAKNAAEPITARAQAVADLMQNEAA